MNLLLELRGLKVASNCRDPQLLLLFAISKDRHFVRNSLDADDEILTVVNNFQNGILVKIRTIILVTSTLVGYRGGLFELIVNSRISKNFYEKKISETEFERELL